MLPLAAAVGYVPRNLDARKRAMTIEDLLTMQSGLAWKESGYAYEPGSNDVVKMFATADWTKYVIDRPMAGVPGTTFVYNSGAAHLVSAAVALLARRPAAEVAARRLFAPLGIQAYRWPAAPGRLSPGGFGLLLQPRDFAKLAFLYLHHGRWDGRPVVPAAWVEQSTTDHVADPLRATGSPSTSSPRPGSSLRGVRLGQRALSPAAGDVIVRRLPLRSRTPRRGGFAAAVLAAAAAAALALAAPAAASELIGRNAKNVTLAADGSGRALVTFTSGGATHRVLAWGAVDARPPSTSKPQVEFKLDMSGGTVSNTCKPVKLALAWLVTACRASDGSYWALQSWQRLLPNGGARPSATQSAWELRLSHWTGATADLTVRFGWSYRRYLQLYGRYTYREQPVFGFRVRNGVPLDGYGRNVYVDALESDAGHGWQRVNSFLAHSPTGGFCYGFFPHGGRTGVGTRFRATVIGPGVTPDLMWEGTSPKAYSAEADQRADADLAALLKGDNLCRPN